MQRQSPSERVLPPAAIALLLGLLLVGACMALGGVFAFATGVLAALAGLLLCFAPRLAAPRESARRLLWLGVGLAVYTLITVLPLPAALWRRLAPAQAEVWAGAFTPFGHDAPTWISLSLDPTATWVELAKLALYGCVFIVSLGLAERRLGITALERVVTFTASAVAMVSLWHFALGKTEVFDFYQPELPHIARHVSVFLNANHLAEVMAMGAAVAMGVVAADVDRARRIEGALALAVCTLGTALAASRGGLVAYVLGCGVALFGTRTHPSRARARAGVAIALVCGGMAVFVVAWSDVVRNEAFSRDLEKLDIFQQSLPLLFRYGLFGIGRGAFEAVSPEARRALGSYVFTHPENLLLQWSIEWGVIATAIACVLLVRSLGPRVLRGRAQMPWGAYGALIAFFAQNMVDYGSEVPGVALLAVCCTALVVGGSRAPSDGRPRRTPRWIRFWPYALAGCAIVLGARAALFADRELWVETRARSSQQHQPDSMARLQEAVEHHPAEAHFAYLGGLEAAASGRSVVPWVSRALDRSPIHGRAHLLLARELEARAPTQARLEYRLAYLQDANAAAGYAAAAARLAHSYEEARELLPRDEETVSDGAGAGAASVRVPAERKLAALSALAEALHASLPATRSRLYREAQANYGDLAIGANAALAQDATQDAIAHEPWCTAGDGCRSEAQAAVSRWVASAPTSTAAQVAALHLIALGNPSAALQRTHEVESSVDDPLALLMAASEIAYQGSLRVEAAELLTQATERCFTPESCERALTLGIAVLRRRGRPEQALMLLRRKSELLPQDGATWRERAALAEEIGLFTESAEALEELRVLVPTDASSAEALRRVRSKQLARGLPKRDAGAD